ncbi:winged-helix domain-containing protein [Metabacillus dongyingensis]|uniref:winged-helix domain-containing protein n=1 Tax=Metabacillus dongyingensis TaxID=2874282 RepID=UPI003B8BAEC8
MTYNHKHGHLPRQTQEILRRRDELDRAQTENYKKMKDIEKKILEFLSEQDKPVSANYIAQSLKLKMDDTLKALRNLSKVRKVETLIVNVNETGTPHYKLIVKND